MGNIAKNEDSYSVYCHYFPNGKVYVGITSREPEKRWLKDGYGYKDQGLMYSAIKKYGWNNIEHIILASCVSYKSAKNIEIAYIEIYDSTNRKNGYNISPGGDLISEESRLKISKTHTGFRHSEESKKKMSESRKGKKKSENHKKKIGEAHRGVKMSEEFRRKMSEIAKNRKCDSTNDPRNVSVLQYSIIDGSFVSRYRSLSEAARQTGANKLHISECAREIRRQVLDCIWVYESMATEKYIESRLMTARLNKSFNPVVLHNISNNATLYCENMAKASRFLGVGKTTVRTAISLNRECKGYLIKKVSIDEYLNVMKN